MRFKLLSALLIALLILPFFVNCAITVKAQTTDSSPSLYLGVDVAFDSIAQTEQLIDNVSTYTNFFIIGCAQWINNGLFGGSYNETRLSVIAQYVYDKGLSFIVYSDDPSYPSKQWIENASENYGGKFLGIYYWDEPGGKQLDQTDSMLDVVSAENFSEAAKDYVNTFRGMLNEAPSGNTPCQLFTSDYGLYWYDYEAGYNTIFAEFGCNSGFENYSRQLSMDLCRGAATAFNQNWGVMITWAYQNYPYMENGTDLYNDMTLAYNYGAKYIVIFDTNANYTQNVLSSDQLNAINQFWQYAQSHPRTVSEPSDRAAYVLPQDFGAGFRSPNDTIWGLWDANWDGTASLTFVADISMCVTSFMQMLNVNLDIIYPDCNQTVLSEYKNVIYWNDTTLVPNMPAMPNQNTADKIHKSSPSPPPNESTRQPTTTPQSYTTPIEFGVVAAVMASLFTTGAIVWLRRRQFPNKLQSAV